MFMVNFSWNSHLPKHSAWACCLVKSRCWAQNHFTENIFSITPVTLLKHLAQDLMAVRMCFLWVAISLTILMQEFISTVTSSILCAFYNLLLSLNLHCNHTPPWGKDQQMLEECCENCVIINWLNAIYKVCRFVNWCHKNIGFLCYLIGSFP